jgi:hypothetical protein
MYASTATRRGRALGKPLVELEDPIAAFNDDLTWTVPFGSPASLGEGVRLGYELTQQASGTHLFHGPAAFHSLDEEAVPGHVLAIPGACSAQPLAAMRIVL